MVFTPVWEGVVEGHAINIVKKDLWKFERILYEFGDLLNEAYLVFVSCRDKFISCGSYEGDKKLFMSYFQRSLHNRFYDLSIESSAIKTNIVDNDLSCLEFCLIGERASSVECFLSKEVPYEIKQVFSLIFNLPNEYLELLGFRKKGTRGFFSNKRISALLGVPEEEKILDKVRSFLLSRV